MSTGQSNFLNRENQVKVFAKEKKDQVDRQKMLIDLKLKIALELPIDEEPLDEDQISVAHARIYKEQSSDFLGV